MGESRCTHSLNRCIRTYLVIAGVSSYILYRITEAGRLFHILLLVDYIKSLRQITISIYYYV